MRGFHSYSLRYSLAFYKSQQSFKKTWPLQLRMGLAMDQSSHADAHSNPSEGRLAGKVAVITGAARGIGRATAEVFAKEGAKVVVADVREEDGRAVVTELGEDCALFCLCDVSKEGDVAAAVDAALGRWGRLDVMHNNAGIGGSPARLEEVRASDFEALAAVNVGGVLIGMREGARAMKARGRGGCIINTGSAAAELGGLAPPLYTATKAAVRSLTRSGAHEMGAYGIRVNCISPSAVPAERLIDALLQKEAASSSPQTGGRRRRMTLEELSTDMQLCDRYKGPHLSAAMVARIALFLADDRSGGYINGQNIVVDGGLTATKVLEGWVQEKLIKAARG